jgi:hypothetical protein
LRDGPILDDFRLRGHLEKVEVQHTSNHLESPQINGIIIALKVFIINRFWKGKTS